MSANYVKDVWCVAMDEELALEACAALQEIGLHTFVEADHKFWEGARMRAKWARAAIIQSGWDSIQYVW